MTRLPELGAPGIYRQAAPVRSRLNLPRMDVCAFVGVAPRGPAREPMRDGAWSFDRPGVEAERPRRRSVAVAVESFEAYRHLYGGFAGPGRLPFAVGSFFEQGGRRAYIVRVLHDYGAGHPDNAAGTASGRVPGAVPSAGVFRLHARNEGSWGNKLRAALGFSTLPLALEAAATRHLVPSEHGALPAGALLRLTLPGGARQLRFVRGTGGAAGPDQTDRARVALFDPPVAEPPLAAEVVEGILRIDDGDGRREIHRELGLSRSHPRWLGTVLCHESELVYPDPSWVEGELLPERAEDLPEGSLPPSSRAESEARFQGGADRYEDLRHEDFFDPDWVPGDPEPGDGIHALVHLPDLSSVVVPDLYVPQPLPPLEQVLDPPPRAGATFARCLDTAPRADIPQRPPATLPGLQLDPAVPEDLERIVALQRGVVELADRLERFVALLDVPPSLTSRQILRWRSQFRSSYAAAYHPWLLVNRSDQRRDKLIRLNPAAAAAGIIARQELAFGLSHGPANAIADGAVDVDREVSPREHDELHALGINVYLKQREGIRLTAARTLARDPRYRQLTVRRLLLLLRRALGQQTHWMLFEPNGPSLWSDIRHLLGNFLDTLYQQGAFRGATAEEAFFVRCDKQLNTRQVTDAGRLLVHVGVAPSEPAEFIVLRLTADADGTVRLEE